MVCPVAKEVSGMTLKGTTDYTEEDFIGYAATSKKRTSTNKNSRHSSQYLIKNATKHLIMTTNT